MRLSEITPIAQQIATALEPACERIQIAGSIRRQKPEPKDVEIVFIPDPVERQTDLFSTDLFPATDDAIEELIDAGVLAWDTVVKRNGPKYKRLIHCASGVVIELFAATRENWGLILALRTGPGDFNKVLVSKPWAGGAMPLNVRMNEGYLWHDGERCYTPTEEVFFATLRLPCWPPEQRTVERLRAYLEKRR